MANYLIRNSLNPSKVVKCTITFRQIVNKGEAGEPVWLVELGTNELDKAGNKIPPEFIHYTTSDNLDAAIEEASKKIASKINWEPLIEDLRPPFVVYNYPVTGDTSVDIDSDVVIDLKDVLPAAGIDIDNIEMIVNGEDVSNEIRIVGDPFSCRLIWGPNIRVREYYE